MAQTPVSLMRAFALAAILVVPAADLAAQALPKAPAPLPTDTELELAKIEDLGEIMARAERWRGEGDLRRYTYAVERLHALRPYSPTFLYRLAEAYAMQDEKTKSYDTLIKIQRQGLAMNPDKDKDFDKVRDTPAFKYIVEGIVVNETPWGDGKIAFNLDGAPELVEAMAWDGKRKRFLVGSVRTGDVLAVDRQGKAKPFIQAKEAKALRSVFALAVDEARDFLWIGTAGAPQFEGITPAEVGAAALVKFELSSGKFLEAYPVPAGGIPRSIAAITVAADGTVYATDPIANVVYQVAGGTLRQLFDVPGSTSLRGIAISADSKHLYFVDYELGLRVADLGKAEVRALSMTDHNLGGIDGLYYYQDHLIAVQNGSVPPRVLRIKLDPEKGAMTAVQPLEANKDALEMPTWGALVGDEFYFIANSQRDQYDATGKPFPDVKVVPRSIYQLSARFAWTEEAGEQHRPLVGDTPPKGE
jgi:hypothetical protein